MSNAANEEGCKLLHERRILLGTGDELRIFCVSPIRTNCYAYISKGECLVVDPGDKGKEIAEALAETRVTQVVATHGHNDHVSGVAALLKATGATFAMAKGDVAWARDHSGRPDHFGLAYGSSMPYPDRLLAEGDVVAVGDARFTVYATPGHTPGGIVLLGSASASGYCFVGDTIFRGSYGRCDLEGGDEAAMSATLHRLASIIPGSTLLLCGHGQFTTMAAEVASTPFYD